MNNKTFSRRLSSTFRGVVSVCLSGRRNSHALKNKEKKNGEKPGTATTPGRADRAPKTEAKCGKEVLSGNGRISVFSFFFVLNGDCNRERNNQLGMLWSSRSCRRSLLCKELFKVIYFSFISSAVLKP